jgi:DNA-binding CsgD family transcriptional regulator/tetratricopeptide (TPR) repeat protein
MKRRAGPIMGRTDELGLLDQVLADLDDGRPAAIALVGEPGIGKTRLLAELAARADARGWLVLSGSASELERDLPFSVFVDALDDYLRGLDPSLLANLAEDVRTELAHVFPSLSTLATPGVLALQHERYRTHRAVRALLEHLAATGPLVLTLDDLQWADSASVELLGALLRRPPATAELTALALRSYRVPERLWVALERAQRAGSLIRVDLGALTPAESRALLADVADIADPDLLYEESGGNPFYLEQLARSLGRSGGTTTASRSLPGLRVPPAVAASLSEELTLLSDDARVVLEGAAVAGDPFEPELAAAAAAKPEAAAMDAIDELLRLDLVNTTEVPRRFRFRHPLVRRAVYEATAGGWRLGAHERCAEALTARGASAAARAHHVERSAREGDLGAVGVLREAGEAAVRLAPASAARWFADALRLLPPSAPAQERAELLLARASALTAVGRFAESRSALVDALVIAPVDSYEMRTRLTRACAAVESNLGRHAQAGDRLEKALASLPDQGSPDAVALLIDLAMNGLWRARYAEMQESAERAVHAARLLQDRPLVAAGLAVLAFADSMTGAAERARSACSEAAAVVGSLADEELARRLDAGAWLAGAELYLDRYAEADRHAGRALALGRATGQGELFLVLVQILGRVWFVRGRLAEAAELLDGGIEAARLLGNTQALVWNLFNRSVVALAAGDMETALSTAQESVDLSRGFDEGFHSAWAAVRLAAALLDTGEPEPAVELLLGSAGGEGLVLIPGSWRAYCLELLTRCWLVLDRPAEAGRAAASAEAWASAVQLPLATAWAARARAAVDLCADDPARAAERALESAAVADEAGAPIEAALARTLAGSALARAGQGDRAVAELQRATTDLETCGALHHRDRAERELRKLGHHIHRRTRAGRADGVGIDSLTERELQVARLVADRRTNPEIAAELFLSQKTVEAHLRNIFRKVDVSSRVALARAVERAERDRRTTGRQDGRAAARSRP